MTFFSRVAIVILLGGLPFVSSAQFVSLSPKVGLGHVFYIGDAYYKREWGRMAPVLGLGTRYKIAENQSVTLELLYSQERHDKHYKNVFHATDFMPGPSEFTEIVRKHQVVLPLSYQAGFGAKKNWFWTAGAYVSYLAMLQTTYIEGNHRSTRKYAPQGDRWALGILGGVGIKLPIIAGDKICLELKTQFDVKDNAFRLAPWLLVGYEFGLKKADEVSKP